MVLTREMFRSKIYYDFKFSLIPQQSVAWLQATFVNEAPYKSTVYS